VISEESISLFLSVNLRKEQNLRADYPKQPVKSYKTLRALILPKNVMRYTATKLQVMIRKLDQTDPSKINMKDYIMLVKEFESMAKKVKNQEGKVEQIRVGKNL
jgi:hypothetical protein